MSEPPFAGILVIECGQFVAVPVAAQLLADGGAEWFGVVGKLTVLTLALNFCV